MSVRFLAVFLLLLWRLLHQLIVRNYQTVNRQSTYRVFWDAR